MSGEPPDDQSETAALRRQPRCGACGYDLEGLPDMGTCPECGDPYTVPDGSWPDPRVDQRAICLRLGWPLLVVTVLAAITGVAWIVGLDELRTAVLFFVLPPAMLVVVYGTIITAFAVPELIDRYVPPERRTRGMLAGLRALGPLPTAIILVELAALAVGAVLWVTTNVNGL